MNSSKFNKKPHPKITNGHNAPSDSAILFVQVQPNAKETQIVSFKDNILKIKIKAAPVDGIANEVLITFLAKTLRISKSQIKLLKGQTNRIKRLEILGIQSLDFLELFKKEN